MRWLIIVSSCSLLAGCYCPQPQGTQYQQRMPPSIYHAPPSMYSTVLRRNKQGKLVRVRVRNPAPSTTAPITEAGSSEPQSMPSETVAAPPGFDSQVESDLNDLAVRVNEMRRRMSREP